MITIHSVLRCTKKLTSFNHIIRYAIRFQMFAIRSFPYVFLQRISCSPSIRCHSSTTNNHTNTSSSDNTNKPPVNSTSWATSDTNGLIKQLSGKIKATGPITVAEFMRESLLNPQHVRYALQYQFFLLCYSFTYIETNQKNLVTIIILSGLLHTP